MTLDEKKEWVKDYCGSSFVKGVAIKGNTAIVEVIKEGGKVEQTKISLPNNSSGLVGYA